MEDVLETLLKCILLIWLDEFKVLFKHLFLLGISCGASQQDLVLIASKELLNFSLSDQVRGNELKRLQSEGLN